MQHAFKFAPDASPPAPALPKVAYDMPADTENWTGIALVGEAPGADEVRLGHPFVGRSGQFLDKMLTQAGIDRRNSFVGNVFRFQPPGNKVDHFFISRRAAQATNLSIAEEWGTFGSTWCRGEFSGEIVHLRTALAALKPKIILALGRTALWALTGENGLLEKLGKKLPCRLVPGVQVIPTFHPSFILRGNWARQDEWLSHLTEAAKSAKPSGAKKNKG